MIRFFALEYSVARQGVPSEFGLGASRLCELHTRGYGRMHQFLSFVISAGLIPSNERLGRVPDLGILFEGDRCRIPKILDFMQNHAGDFGITISQGFTFD